ncbi:hypothetical protein SAMN05421770_102477 [Granulicella rosea]|uniref:Uncharacterized protein n=1 Tax=Granulicella rosea TaxID=474952 RepID=A0A239HR85_9BACT|nr:hypothetical protein [Granulicella rosea]SNS82804.1 hypothetical protein SAMN05421770_102477 [Granulicella rosea]
MLPFEERSWAKPVARFNIVFSILAVAAGLSMLRLQGPLDTAEITAGILVLLAIIPPSIAVLRYDPTKIRVKKTLRVTH